ncbi:MAG: hypothetical protein HOP12_09775, partial [Candidatus Eisenbacteria bacterium]|nr:hypothetical protein [Candidatus Eisenbacteria bacterium]
VPPGVTTERREGDLWSATADLSGTPLAPPLTLPPLTGALELTPSRVRPGEPLRLSWSLPWSGARVTLRVFDLAGRPAAVALSEARVTARGETRWTPRDLAPGLYLMALEARGGDADATLGTTRPFRVVKAGP